MKIKIPETKKSSISLKSVPDFSKLPHIPKLAMKLTIDDITSVSSQTVNVSPTQTKDVAKSLHSLNLDMQRTHSGSGEVLSTLDTPPLVGKPIQLSNPEVDRVGYSSTFSKCRPALL